MFDEPYNLHDCGCQVLESAIFGKRYIVRRSSVWKALGEIDARQPRFETSGQRTVIGLLFTHQWNIIILL